MGSACCKSTNTDEKTGLNYGAKKQPETVDANLNDLL
jgi:hypothetical protein